MLQPLTDIVHCRTANATTVAWPRVSRRNDSGAAVGGSTLATQIEKFRHSPGGRTSSALGKLRQLGAASLKAYRDGPNTRSQRRRIVVNYLNSMPLPIAVLKLLAPQLEQRLARKFLDTR